MLTRCKNIVQPKFTLMTILAKIGFCRQEPIFASKKTIFASPVFTAEKPFFPPSGKNLPTLISELTTC